MTSSNGGEKSIFAVENKLHIGFHDEMLWDSIRAYPAKVFRTVHRTQEEQ